MSSDQLEVGIDDVNWVERMCPDSQTPVKKITIEWQLFELCTFYCIKLINLTQRKQRHVGWADSDDVSLQGQECICNIRLKKSMKVWKYLIDTLGTLKDRI